MLLSLVFGYSKLVGAFVVSGHKSAYGAHRYQLSISNVKGARRLPVWKDSLDFIVLDTDDGRPLVAGAGIEPT